MQEQATLAALQELGLTLSEAKIYLALLANSPVNGNQVSRQAGVPSAKVYENLEKLCGRGLVALLDEGKYVPLDLEEFLQERESRVQEVGQLLRDAVRRKIHDIHGEILWHGRGYRALIDRAERLIHLAGNELLISAWPSELERLVPAVEQALSKGVHVAVMVFATPQEVRDLFSNLLAHEHLNAFSHAMFPTVHARHGEQATFVADNATALLMSGAGNAEWLGVWTSNPAVVQVVANYIRHDIYINKLYGAFGQELEQAYGKHLTALLDPHQDGETVLQVNNEEVAT